MLSGPRQGTEEAPPGTTLTTLTTLTLEDTAGPPAQEGLVWDWVEDSCWVTLSGKIERNFVNVLTLLTL